MESANKLVVERRLKGSGMHWARAHVNPMVLRAMACSDRWPEAWPQIVQRVRQQPGKVGGSARYPDDKPKPLCSCPSCRSLRHEPSAQRRWRDRRLHRSDTQRPNRSRPKSPKGRTARRPTTHGAAFTSAEPKPSNPVPSPSQNFDAHPGRSAPPRIAVRPLPLMGSIPNS